MSDVTIDKVQIEVEGQATKAIDTLVKLENALKKVKSAMGGFNTSGIDDLQKKLDAAEQSAKRVSNTKVTPKVDTSNITKSEKQITNSFNNLQDKFTRLSALGNAALGGDKSAITSFKRQAVSMQAEIDVLQNKMRRLGDTRIKSEAFENIEKQIESLNGKWQNMMAEGSKKPMSEDAFVKMQIEIQNVENEIDNLIDKQRQMIQDGTAYTDPLQQYRDNAIALQHDFDVLRERVNSINNAKPTPNTSPYNNKIKDSIRITDSLLSRLAQIGKQGIGNIFNNIKNSASKTGSTISNLSDIFGKGFFKILKYGFGIRSLYVLFRRLRKSVVDSFGELQKSGAFWQTTKANVEALKTSLTTLKFQFGAAFEPIFNAVAPALQTLINYLIEAMNVISAFMAKITGKDTYSKVASVTLAAAKNTSSAAKAAKELNKQLQGFDELNNLTSNNSSGGGGGNGSDNNDHATYTEESIDSDFGKAFKDLFDILKKAWDDSTVVAEATTALNNIKSLISTIGTTFYNVFTKGYGYDWLSSVFSLLSNIVGIVGDLARTFKEAWDEGKRGEQLVESIFTTATNINAMFSSIAQSFRSAWNDETGKKICADILEIITNINTIVGNLTGRFTEAWNSAGLGDSIMKGILTIVSDISGFINDITKATADWASKLNFVPILESIKKLTDGIHKLLDPILKIAKDIYEKAVLPIAKQLIEKNLPSFVNKVAEGLERAGEALTSIQPLISKIAPLLGTIAGSGIDGVFKAIGEVIGAISGELKLVKDVVDWFSAKWAKFKEVVDDVKKALEPYKPVLEPIIEFLKLLLQFIGIEDPFPNLAENFKEAIKDLVIPDSVQKVMDFFNLYNDLAENGQSNISMTFKGIEDKSFTDAKKKFDELKDKDATITGKGKDASGGILDKLKGVWETIKPGNSEATITGKGKQADSLKNLAKKWKKIKKKTITLTAKGSISNKSVLDTIKSYWSLGNVDIKLNATATFTDKFTSALNNFTKKVNDANDAFNGKKALGGAYYGGAWHDIPQFAGGTANAFKHGSVFIAGENGPEVAGHINGRTEILNRSQLASIMYTSITRGMAQFKNAQITTPQSLGFADNIASGIVDGMSQTSTNNNGLIEEQNRLIAEQNGILRQILQKPSGITSREVFDATRKEAQNYNNRTGNSPFLF